MKCDLKFNLECQKKKSRISTISKWTGAESRQNFIQMIPRMAQVFEAKQTIDLSSPCSKSNVLIFTERIAKIRWKYLVAFGIFITYYSAVLNERRIRKINADQEYILRNTGCLFSCPEAKWKQNTIYVNGKWIILNNKFENIALKI